MSTYHIDKSKGAVLLPILACVLSACGGGSDTAGTDASTGATPAIVAAKYGNSWKGTGSTSGGSTTTTSTSSSSTSTTSSGPTSTTTSGTTGTTTSGATSTSTSVTTGTTTTTTSGYLQPAATSTLPVPTTIVDSSTIKLQCGAVYHGTLQLQGHSNVSVVTDGTCGNATITPASPITGWTQYSGNIYSAPISTTPTLVTVDGKQVSPAHWPNATQTWVTGTSPGANQVTYSVPNGDVVGANLVYRANDWAIVSKQVTGYSSGVMSLSSTISTAYDAYAVPASPKFYLEGKLWMLDSPGEWAVSNGRLYMWTPDGQSPEGRVWASPDADAINASSTSGVTISGVNLFGGKRGILGANSTNLHISSVQIASSGEDGISVDASSGLVVDGVNIMQSRHNGISSRFNSTNTIVKNSKVTDSGVVGMPTHSRGGIFFAAGSGTTVDSNTVTNSGYIGIRVYKSATVSNNVVDTACSVLTDCGGIYTFARDQLPSNVTIRGNTVKHLANGAAYGIYLDDYANGVTVDGNILSDNPNGILVHNGFNNIIQNNTFSNNRTNQVFFSENGTATSVRNNQVMHNTFTTPTGVLSYRLESKYGLSSALQFGAFDYNAFNGGATSFAYLSGESQMLNWSGWLGLSPARDRNSTMTGG